MMGRLITDRRVRARALNPRGRLIVVRRLLVGIVIAVVAASGLGGGAAAASDTGSRTSVGELVSQLDNRLGFRVLRPAGWISVDLGYEQGYVMPASSTAGGRLVLTITNLETVGKAVAAGTGQVVPYTLFQRSATFADWMTSIETLWRSLGIGQFSTISAETTRASYLVQPGSAEVDLVGYVVRQGVPLEITLAGYGDLGRTLKSGSAGLRRDFAAMEESLTPSPGTFAESVFDTPASQLTPASGPWHSDSGYHAHGQFTWRLQTDYYQAPPEIYWLYEYMYYAMYQWTTMYIYRADLSDNPSWDCGNQDSNLVYTHVVNKWTTSTNGTVIDDYYPIKIVSHLNPGTAHVMLYGNAGAPVCHYYFPFTH